MSALAQQYNAINLAQGFPNFEIDEALQNALIEATKSDAHQYAPMAGNLTLREEIARLVYTYYLRRLETTQVLITAGATQAIYTAITALIKADEEVLILDPSYDCYEAPILLVGAKAKRIALAQDFKPDWELIEESVGPKTKMLIINNPHNPSGTIWDAKDFRELENLMSAHPQLILLSDEVYEFITYEPHQSIHQYSSIRERAIIVSSFGKSFHITGWKIGYLVCNEAWMKEIHKVHQFLVFSVNSVAQHALALYLKETDLNQVKKLYKQKRDLFRAGMKKSNFGLLPAQGSYFQVASIAEFTDLSDYDFCIHLTKNHGVAAIPLSVFNANGQDRGLIRFCYAKTDETLETAIERLCKI